MQDELGGHLVSGHVHCQATLVDIIKTSTNCQLRFSVDSLWQKYILPKGYIAINGISLTVGEASSTGFNVHLIPETLNRTNLSRLGINQQVNIECDQQTITIVNTIERIQQQVT
jgi:riboflavin synthase